MNIAFILPGSSVSGGTRSTVIVANGLVAQGHSVRILFKKGNMLSIRNLYKWMMNLFASRCQTLRDFNGKATGFTKIKNIVLEKNEIIVAVGMWSSAQLTHLSAPDSAMLQYIHGTTPWNVALMDRALRLNIPKVVVASHLVAAVESYKTNQILAVIPNGVDRNQYYSSDAFAKDGIGTVFSSHPSKDPRTVIDVFRRFSASNPEVPFRVFSKDRRPKSISRSAFYRNPSIEKARAIYSSSLIWIVASCCEGFSMPILEAMACGAVVIATDCGGPRDIIVDGHNGFIVDVGDVDQIIDRVTTLLSDRRLLNMMRVNAGETVKRFTWQRTTKELELALAKL